MADEVPVVKRLAIAGLLVALSEGIAYRYFQYQCLDRMHALIQRIEGFDGVLARRVDRPLYRQAQSFLNDQ